jgi:hypothetical protein
MPGDWTSAVGRSSPRCTDPDRQADKQAPPFVGRRSEACHGPRPLEIQVVNPRRAQWFSRTSIQISASARSTSRRTSSQRTSPMKVSASRISRRSRDPAARAAATRRRLSPCRNRLRNRAELSLSGTATPPTVRSESTARLRGSRPGSTASRPQSARPGRRLPASLSLTGRTPRQTSYGDRTGPCSLDWGSARKALRLHTTTGESSFLNKMLKISCEPV